MKIGFNQATTLDSSNLKTDMQLCEKYGYDFIEIRLDKLKEYLQTNTVEDLKAFFNQAKLKPLAFNAIEFFTFQNDTIFENQKNDLRFLQRIGKEINCDTIVVVPTFEVPNPSKAEVQRETVDKLKCLLEVLDSDMRLAFEFVGYPHCSVNTLEQAYDIVKEVNDPRVGLVVDCFHLHAMNSNIALLKDIDKEKIFLFHIDDSEDKVPGSLRDHHRLWPGDGVIDLEIILHTLHEKGFKGPASLELFRPEYWSLSPDECISTGIEKTSKMLAKCLAK
ncbi:sugar phosphate isomerase/epimerase [Bacillus shivajii]|uniref:sugar phosphate isomerase/epimerase family protein n=1 Tax=Bacillus shivajii TaxID=1983719 RepID=UPI001CF96FE0|nr:sugar phosphate isomerase/epimerase [Bacillus shivajii]UCZ52815.1 sugar phosphate isomerase/epimerase [Bacillus shivajii]